MKRTLLLVDDEVNILQALKRVFEEDDYLILTAPSAKEGLVLLAEHPVQVIISDQNMPEMKGSEFFKIVKEKYPDTIRIILSAYSDFNDLRDAINDSAIYKFLNKPWEESLLRLQVTEAFQINAAQREKEIQLIRLVNQAKLTSTKTKSTLVTEAELENALGDQQFVIYYQPIVDTCTGKIKVAEALLRWQHPRHGLLT